MLRLDGPIEDIGPWFIASYDGTCRGCGGEIEQGDSVRYCSGELFCHGCGNSLFGPVANPTCPVCFMVKSNNGSCNCDEE